MLHDLRILRKLLKIFTLTTITNSGLAYKKLLRMKEKELVSSTSFSYLLEEWCLRTNQLFHEFSVFVMIFNHLSAKLFYGIETLYIIIITCYFAQLVFICNTHIDFL